jgi:hypothetical protein
MAQQNAGRVADFFSRPLSYAVEEHFHALAQVLIKWRTEPSEDIQSDRSRLITSDDAKSAMRIAIKHSDEAEHLVWRMIGKHGDKGIAYSNKSGIKCYAPVTSQDQKKELVVDTSIEIATDLWSCGEKSDEDGNTALICALQYDCVDLALAIVKRNRASES